MTFCDLSLMTAREGGHLLGPRRDHAALPLGTRLRDSKVAPSPGGSSGASCTDAASAQSTGRRARRKPAEAAARKRVLLLPCTRTVPGAREKRKRRPWEWPADSSLLPSASQCPSVPSVTVAPDAGRLAPRGRRVQTATGSVDGSLLHPRRCQVTPRSALTPAGAGVSGTSRMGLAVTPRFRTTRTSAGCWWDVLTLGCPLSSHSCRQPLSAASLWPVGSRRCAVSAEGHVVTVCPQCKVAAGDRQLLGAGEMRGGSVPGA